MTNDKRINTFLCNVFVGDPPNPFDNWYQWCESVNRTGIVRDVFIRAVRGEDYIYKEDSE